MKILMVTYRFPPYNSIGAIRCGKMAKYLIELGHEVKVLSCIDQPLPSTLEIEIPTKNIRYANWWDINAPVNLLVNRKKDVTASLNSVGNKNTLKSKILNILGSLYKILFHLPDGQIGWRRNAYREGLDIIATWKPDVIYASAWPISSLIVADKISQKSGIPWIGELRDLWTDNPYSDTPKWKKYIEKLWEKRLFSRAIGLTTISEHANDILVSKFSKPTEIILNGYDEKDFEKIKCSNDFENIFTDNKIHILYAGMIYPGRRDPTPLLKAISLLSEKEKNKVTVHFYGNQLEIVTELATKLNIEKNIVVNNPISHKNILYLQTKADYLLLLMWDNPDERGTFTGKFFEYVGANRPILCIGGADNPPAKVIQEHQMGYVLQEPDEIKALILDLINQKKEKGYIQNTRPSNSLGFTRKKQAAKLSTFLKDTISDEKS
jgi:hypothetical protein